MVTNIEALRSQQALFKDMGYEERRKNFLNNASVEQRGESGRNILIKGRPGSHQVNEDDIVYGVIGKDLVPEDLTEDYESFEAYWIWVAAGKYPELVSELKQKSGLVASAANDGLDGLVQDGEDEHLKKGISLINHSYADFVDAVKYNLALRKQSKDAREYRDIKRALTTAIHGYTLKQIAQGYKPKESAENAAAPASNGAY